VRILFIARRFSYLKNFEGPILELARRGHALHLVALAGEGKLEGSAIVQRWADSEPGITFERLPPAPQQQSKLGLRARISMMVDYLRYLDPAYQDAGGLIERARRRTPVGFLRLVESKLARFPSALSMVAALLKRLEVATPRRPELDAFLRAHQADAVLFTPLIALQSEEQDLLAAAAEQGLRTVFCVLSWDNLSSKALVRTMPDLVTVWNEVQRHEARHLHGVPDDRVVVTGAQTFDIWFDRAPSKPRAEFLARVGLPADRPFLLWVCSSLFRTSPVEEGFVRRWIQMIRASEDPLLRDVSILVRPHPARMLEWAKTPLDSLGPVSLWGQLPVDTESRNDYFDSMYYSEAVAGLNTSAFIEAAIVGKPVYTVILPEFHESQAGTLHFPYLLNVGGGLLHAAQDMETHMADLAAALHDPGAGAERSRRFVEAFVRPHGLANKATDRFVDAIEDLMRRPAPSPTRPLQPGLLAERLYAWLEPRSHAGAVKAWLTTENEINNLASREAKLAKARAREAALIAARTAHEQAKEEKRLRQDEARRQQKQAAREAHIREREAAERAKAEAHAERQRAKLERRQQHRAAKRAKSKSTPEESVQ